MAAKSARALILPWHWDVRILWIASPNLWLRGSIQERLPFLETPFVVPPITSALLSESR
jgi:hypothetical protein